MGGMGPIKGAGVVHSASWQPDLPETVQTAIHTARYDPDVEEIFGLSPPEPQTVVMPWRETVEPYSQYKKEEHYR